MKKYCLIALVLLVGGFHGIGGEIQRVILSQRTGYFERDKVVLGFVEKKIDEANASLKSAFDIRDDRRGLVDELIILRRLRKVMNEELLAVQAEQSLFRIEYSFVYRHGYGLGVCLASFEEDLFDREKVFVGKEFGVSDAELVAEIHRMVSEIVKLEHECLQELSSHDERIAVLLKERDQMWEKANSVVFPDGRTCSQIAGSDGSYRGFLLITSAMWDGKENRVFEFPEWSSEMTFVEDASARLQQRCADVILDDVAVCKDLIEQLHRLYLQRADLRVEYELRKLRQQWGGTRPSVKDYARNL
jgi:hypothetical protein